MMTPTDQPTNRLTDRPTNQSTERTNILQSAFSKVGKWKAEICNCFHFHVYAPQCMIQNGGFGWLYVKEEWANYYFYKIMIIMKRNCMVRRVVGGCCGWRGRSGLIRDKSRAAVSCGRSYQTYSLSNVHHAVSNDKALTKPIHCPMSTML